MVENIDLPEQLVNKTISGGFDNQLFVIELTLHLTLVASDTPKGRQLFLKTNDVILKIEIVVVNIVTNASKAS